jgi:hypothetical protein
LAAAHAQFRCAWTTSAIALVLCSPFFVGAALAQDDPSPDLQQLRSAVEQQQRQIEAQQHQLDEQRQQIDRRLQSQSSNGLPAADLDAMRARDAATAPIVLAQQDESSGGGGDQSPVGEAPPPRDITPERAALPQEANVLTPQGHFALEPSLEYVNADANRLVFRGIEIVVGLQIGVIEASDTNRDVLVAAATARYGLADRLELEVRVPYVYRHDRVLTLAQRDEQIIREFDMEGSNIGDIEGSLRYQINSGRHGGPIYIANLRLKSDTGSSPFEIDRDSFGVLEELPTGSGFWALEPGVTVLVPSDPVVIYASLSYLYHMPADIDRDIGNVHIGNVDPGDSIGASLGFGFALNQRFSFSLGYKHNYIYPTETEFGETTQRSEALQVGSMLLGMSYRLNNNATASINYEFGTTADAPDTRIVFRIPYTF